MSLFLTHCEVLVQLEALCVSNLKRYEIYNQRALADPNKPEVSVLAHYFQGRYDAYCMARNMLAEALRGSDEQS